MQIIRGPTYIISLWKTEIWQVLCKIWIPGHVYHGLDLPYQPYPEQSKAKVNAARMHAEAWRYPYLRGKWTLFASSLQLLRQPGSKSLNSTIRLCWSHLTLLSDAIPPDRQHPRGVTIILPLKYRYRSHSKQKGLPI